MVDDFVLAEAAPDFEHERVRLLRDLKRADGFSLLFVVCNNGETRDNLFADLQNTLTDKRIQAVPIRQEVESIRGYLLEVLGEERPDILVIYGLENWISGSVPPESIAVFATLNAARNSFGKSFPMPVIFCIPEYLLTIIMKSAPDFFSVRSGIFLFVRDEAERIQVLNNLAVKGLTQAYSLLPNERVERIRELETLISEHRSQPDDRRDYDVESRILNQIATNYMARGNYEKAEEISHEVISLNERYLGPDHPEILISLNNLAVLYRHQGRLTESESLYLRMLEIDKSIYGENHPEYATSLNNLALLYQSQEKYVDAEKLLLTALKIDVSIYGRNHPEVATDLHNLADLFQQLGRLKKAEEYYFQALKITRYRLGEEHPETAMNLNSLALLYWQQGRLSEAELSLVQALAIAEKSLGLEHPTTKQISENLAMLREKAGKSGR